MLLKIPVFVHVFDIKNRVSDSEPLTLSAYIKAALAQSHFYCLFKKRAAIPNSALTINKWLVEHSVFRIIMSPLDTAQALGSCHAVISARTTVPRWPRGPF